MDNTLRLIKNLEEKAKALEPETATVDQWMEQVSAYLKEYNASLGQMHSYKKGKVDLSATDFSSPKELPQLIEELKQLFEYGITASSGGHLGYIPGGGLIAAGIGDLIAAFTNEYAGMEFGSPGAVAIERNLLKWLRELYGYPSDAVGNLTSGGSIANLIAFTAARDHHGVKNEKVQNAVVYLSEQVHHCVMKAMRIIGLSDVVVRYIPLDDRHRMNVGALEKQIVLDKEKDLFPFIVVASAGTTDTGAIDPLEDIARVSKKFGMWFHIDAAYGGFFILTDEKKKQFKGVEASDSLVIDPHKGMFLPYGLGTVLVKSAEAVLHSHHYVANYMEGAYEGAMEYSPADLSPELTKHFRGLRMWMALKIHGIDAFKAGLREKLYLTEYFMDEIQKRGFKAGPPPDLSVGYFYYPSQSTFEIDDNTFNKKLHEYMLEDGEVFFSTTNISSKFVIRVAILSFRTHLPMIDKGLKMIERALVKTKQHFELI